MNFLGDILSLFGSPSELTLANTTSFQARDPAMEALVKAKLDEKHKLQAEAAAAKVSLV